MGKKTKIAKNYMLLTSAYTVRGCDYIGDPATAERLWKRGIEPELRTPKSQVCSIGYCKRQRKWYGWSHRAIFGYGIGSVVKKGTTIVSRAFPIGYKAKTLADCKRMAIAFAESVS